MGKTLFFGILISVYFVNYGQKQKIDYKEIQFVKVRENRFDSTFFIEGKAVKRLVNAMNHSTKVGYVKIFPKYTITFLWQMELQGRFVYYGKEESNLVVIGAISYGEE